jgi:hypothetical protein
MAIDNKFNYDDVFFRDLSVCLLATLEDKISWVNRFSDGPVEVVAPIYYSMTGNEDFLMDSFQSDIASDAQPLEINTDEYPRGHITLTSWRIKSDEFANPNQWLRMVLEDEEEIRKVLTKIRALPIQASFQLTVLLNSELDTFKASQAIMNTLWLYKYMYFEYNFMRIDAVMLVPEDQEITINREKNLGSDDAIRLTINFDIHTYYPAFNKEHVIERPTGVVWGAQIHSVNKRL